MTQDFLQDFMEKLDKEGHPFFIVIADPPFGDEIEGVQVVSSDYPWSRQLLKDLVDHMGR